jgi:two-component system, OmpR family, sensor histidine kinase KdpD
VSSTRSRAGGQAADAINQAGLIPERVMVCVSSAADAQRVIRAGARIANRLGANWYAVHVDTPGESPDRIRPRDAAALQRNIALAEKLGGTVVRVKASRAADGLIAFAKREGISHVVFGQSARTRWELLIKGSILNRFLHEVGGASVQVVPLTEGAA